jgi:hypothetical protein
VLRAEVCVVGNAAEDSNSGVTGQRGSQSRSVRAEVVAWRARIHPSSVRRLTSSWLARAV